MAKYMVPGTIGGAAVTTTYKTIVEAYAPASLMRRGKVAEIILGSIGLPLSTDCYIQFNLSRLITGTTTWVGTAFTPNPVDPADGPCSSICNIVITTEGAIVANSSLFNDGMNQRGTLRWQEQDKSKMLIWPATAAYGVALQAQSSTYNLNVTGQIGFLE